MALRACSDSVGPCCVAWGVWLALWLALWLWLPVCAMAVEPVGQGRVRRLAVMPFGVFADQGRLVDVTDFVGAAFANRGFSVVSQNRLEQFRVLHRIRRAEFMDRAALRVLGVELGVDALVVGQAHLAGGDVPRGTVTAQMVECGGSSVVWAGSVSASGDDYATVLGLGRIKIMEVLLQRLVEDLLNSVPGEMSVLTSSVPDFEIARAGFQPEVLRGGQPTRLVVEIKPGGEPLRQVRAYLLDREIELQAQGDGHFSGELLAPLVERSYPVRIYVTDAWNRLVTVDTDAMLTVDNSPPPLSVHFNGRLLSPNNDGVLDRILFTPEVGESLYIRSWTVRIADAADTTVRFEEGRGLLPEFFVWRGEDDEGRALPDGEYACTLTVTDRAGNSTATSVQRMVVDTTPPQVEVFLVEADGARVLTLDPGASGQVHRWSLTLFGLDGVLVELHGRETPPATIEAPEGAMAYSLEVWDLAGNRQRVDLSPLIPRKPQLQEMDLRPEKREVWVDDF
ncbi:MAG: hypothetical protein KKE73_03540 [Proteobacteria bacterium]|nr:hypothetical protein [Pseudomonadota bacterium]